MRTLSWSLAHAHSGNEEDQRLREPRRASLWACRADAGAADCLLLAAA